MVCNVLIEVRDAEGVSVDGYESCKPEYTCSFFTASEWYSTCDDPDLESYIDEGNTAEITVEFYQDGDSPTYGDEPIRTSSCTILPDGTVRDNDKHTEQETEADALATSDVMLVTFEIENALNHMIADLACRPHLAQITAYKTLAEKLASAATAAYTVCMAIGRKKDADYIARLNNDLIKAADI